MRILYKACLLLICTSCIVLSFEVDKLVLEESCVSLKLTKIDDRYPDGTCITYEVHSFKQALPTPKINLVFNEGNVRILHSRMCDDVLLLDALHMLQVKLASDNFSNPWDVLVYEHASEGLKKRLKKLGFKNSSSHLKKSNEFALFWDYPGPVAKTPPLTSVPFSTPVPSKPDSLVGKPQPFFLPESAVQ